MLLGDIFAHLWDYYIQGTLTNKKGQILIMSDLINSFEEKLKELVSLGKKNKGILEVEKVNDFFKELNLDVNQIDKIYEYLENHNIAVINLVDDADEEPDEDLLLEMENDEELAMVEDLANTASVKIGRASCRERVLRLV